MGLYQCHYSPSDIKSISDTVLKVSSVSLWTVSKGSTIIGICIQILFMKIYSYVFVCDSLLLSIISTSQVITILLQVTDLLVKCIQYHTLCSYVLRSHLQKFWRHLNVQISFQYSPIICCCIIHLWWKSIEDLYT